MWAKVARLGLGFGLATALAMGLTMGLAACATTSGRNPDGSCYKPLLNACTQGFHEECETGRDGCERCGCAPDRDTEGGPWN